ncbi:anti-sigma regulatory factor [Cyanobacterium stanieri LEGE 03274]|uniref:Anti-sigma regulatory factor n=1 Tax=Cyanobacterium stanieri LEGE 03274 TaxID=1828756 RepID=A0ABR9V544_9CHRO|nr:anti-sigma regulatory factor [Cyanobacterium stanieri]MBE9223003.1 anti-sigma regulatory factor [Cyanobacterium stanieri LEGE 03274]
MISMAKPLHFGRWRTVSFPSTLYLCPVLDLLLTNIPEELHPEIRLGLQEALVNAAKHGNGLDPSKPVVVKFSYHKGEYSWLICDQGAGFCECECGSKAEHLPPEEAENGRGLCMLHHIFDRVLWNKQGTQVKLCKQVHHHYFPRKASSAF